MKHIHRILTFILALATVATAQTKFPLNLNASGEVERNVTFASGKTLTLSGALSGTPTGGTLNLGNVTLTTGTITGGTLELGHATDTTLSRASAGVLAIEGVNVVTVSSTDTLSNKTLTAPRYADLGFIADANGNEMLILDTVESAVNELKLANAATGTNPALSASGGDTNVSIVLTPKGTGGVGIGTSTVSAKLHMLGTTEQLRIGYDTSNYWKTTVGSGGAMSVTPSGSAAWTFYKSDGATTIASFDSFYGRLGVGTASPSAKVHVIDTSEQLRIGYDASNYWKITVGSGGAMSVSPSGSSAWTFYKSDGISAALAINTMTAGITVGGGTAVNKIISATSFLDFGSTDAGGVSDLTMTVTGASAGDVVVLGVPPDSVPARGSYSAWVSASNTVTVRFANNDLSTNYDPGSGTFRATVIQH